MKLLIVSAMDEELKAIEADLDANPIPGVSLAYRQIGMGKVNAAISLTQRLTALPDSVDGIVLYGTAGGLRPTVPLNQLCAIERTWQHDYGLRTNDGFTTTAAGILPTLNLPPEPICVPALLKGHMLSRHPELGWFTAVSGDSFVSADREAAALSQAADLVDMETAVVAQVASHHVTPWLCLRSVSDAADANAADTFDASLKSLDAPTTGIHRIIASFAEYIRMRHECRPSPSQIAAVG